MNFTRPFQVVCLVVSMSVFSVAQGRAIKPRLAGNLPDGWQHMTGRIGMPTSRF